MNVKHSNGPKSTTRFAKAAVDQLGWWGAHRFLILRRISQLSVLSLFAIGPF